MKLSETIEKLDRKEFIFKLHIQEYGVNRQLTVLAEECIELSKASLKIKRDLENSKEINIANIHSFVEEYVDTLLMLKQFESFIDDDKLFRHQLNRKVERAFKRIEHLV